MLYRKSSLFYKAKIQLKKEKAKLNREEEATDTYLVPMMRPVRTSLVAQTVKCLSTMRETWVLSLGREDSLEKEMATHSSTLTWKIPWMEDPGRLQFMGSQSRA